MPDKKRRHRKALIALPFIIVFIVIANLCGTGLLPSWIDGPLGRLNSATGGLLYTQKQDSSCLTVNYIDVGQGDSALIQCGGRDMLIDAGLPEEGATVENYLQKCGVKNLDYVIATHPHDDHIGGLCDVLKDYKAGTIIMSGATTTTQSFKNLLSVIKDNGEKITRSAVGSSYVLGGAKFIILAPVGTYDDLNDMSVVIKLTYKGKSFLFTGDASQKSENDMLKKGEDLKADVLKVGHHGSSTATTQSFLSAVKPQYAVISVGCGNKYGLPNTLVTQRIRNSGAKLLRTDIDGTIVIKTDGNYITYKKEKNSGNFNGAS